MSGKTAQLWHSLLEEAAKKTENKQRFKIQPSSEHKKKLSLPRIKEIMYSAISTHTGKQTYLLETMVFKLKFLFRLYL